MGHGTLRIAVMGFENKPASDEELDRMKGLLEEVLQAGAIGLSLGLMYAPGSYTPRENLTEELAREPAAQTGRALQTT